MIPYKKGFRCLGIAESFRRGIPKSILCGVVMRRDLVIDGVALATATVGGLDATEGVLAIYRSLGRSDINCVMINGCIISWFNIIDLRRVYEETGVPLISVTYEESPGIEQFIRRYFGEDEERLRLYRSLGPREEVYVRRTRARVFVRYYGMGRREVEAVLNAFTTHGRVPEPLRVANLVARAVLRSLPPSGA
ncbi:MAG: DUF99 domain-containing protein [Thermoprotei archaeon]|nr:MAG: DUF99 domain-containing protein [Thermoprotei archaeon]RLE94068.1 MAG: DUF99 domain-containing protein [Thermoprotei archaeon]